MIGHRTRFRRNDDLPLWRGPAVKKKPPSLNFIRFFPLPRRGAREEETDEIQTKSRHFLMRNYAQLECAVQYWGMTLNFVMASFYSHLL